MSSTMLPVEPVVYKNRNIVPGSYYDMAVKKDLVSVCHQPLRQMGYYLSYTGQYKKMATAIGTDTPWHHVKHLTCKRCGIDHGLKFMVFGYVPPKCLECWKVVVSPRTLKELFLLLDVQKSLGRPSKCGIELRHYTPRLYGGYFYNRSLDEGRYCYELVRKAVDEHISPEVGVILKRACTEYEMAKGPSVAWTMTDDEHRIDEELGDLIEDSVPNVSGQNDWCIAQVHTHWIEWAWKHQDKTVDEYLGGQPLYPGTMHYHEGDINEVKADIMKARSVVKHDIQPNVVDSIHAALRGYQFTKGMDIKQFGTVLGFDSINPLFRGEGDGIW